MKKQHKDSKAIQRCLGSVSNRIPCYYLGLGPSLLAFAQIPYCLSKHFSYLVQLQAVAKKLQAAKFSMGAFGGLGEVPYIDQL